MLGVRLSLSLLHRAICSPGYISQSPALSIFRMKESQITIALPNADHNLFVGSSFASSWVTLLSANICFIHFHSTVEHGSVGFSHCRPDSMTEIPSSLIADSKDTLQFVRGESLARLAE